jgi:hypothetical protein
VMLEAAGSDLGHVTTSTSSCSRCPTSRQ